MRGRTIAAALGLGVLMVFASAGPATATHPRPGSGTPFQVPLVPAFTKCTNPNSNHVAPLASPSCEPPQVDGVMTKMGSVGAGRGILRLDVLCTNGEIPPCLPVDGNDEEDVTFRVTLSDVRCAAVGTPGCAAVNADYTGPFLTLTAARMTDHASGNPNPPAPCPQPQGMPPCVTATVSDLAFAIPGQCADNGGPNGGVCNLVTSLDTFIAGTVKELQRTVMALRGASFDQTIVGYQVSDAGPDGTLTHSPGLCPPVCGTGDEQPLARQGIFLP